MYSSLALRHSPEAKQPWPWRLHSLTDSLMVHWCRCNI